MEKIYMEENQKKQSRGKINFSIVLSVFVAVIAVVSLVAVGFDQVSYAAETPTDSATSSFVLKQGTNPLRIQFEAGVGNIFDVPVFYREDGGRKVPVYCVEKEIPAAVDESYTLVPIGTIPENISKFEAKVQYGLLKILSESDSALSGVTNPDVKGAAVQAAIWMFLSDMTGAETPHSLDTGETGNSDADNKTILKTFTTINGIDTSNNSTELMTGAEATTVRTAIANLVQAGKNAGSNDRSLELVVSDKNLTKTSDGAYYQSSKLTVRETTGTDTLKSYTVTATGIDGLKVVDKNGNAKTEFAPTDEFYVQVPAGKVTTAVQRISVKVTGSFDGILTGRYYTYPSMQTVITVEESSKTEDATTTLEVVGSPDTGMSSIQTIYFIGLIVLLCGIGIIYANAKPVEEK